MARVNLVCNHRGGPWHLRGCSRGPAPHLVTFAWQRWRMTRPELRRFVKRNPTRVCAFCARTIEEDRINGLG